MSARPRMNPDDRFAYYFRYIYAKENCGKLLLDDYLYEPVEPPVWKNRHIYLSVVDICRIYAPDMKADSCEDAAYLTYKGKTVGLCSGDCIRTECGKLLLPLDTLMKDGFGKVVNTCFGFTMIEVDSRGEALSAHPGDLIKKEAVLLGQKPFGELGFMVWTEEGKRLVPYRVYVPTCYKAGTAITPVVAFHGGDGNQNYVFDKSQNRIQKYAEKFGMLLIAVNGYCKFTQFGCAWMPVFNQMTEFEAGLENPLGLREDELKASEIAEKVVLGMIDDAAQRFTLDREHMVGMGNSMGSAGCFYYAAKYPDMFRAVVPSGGAVDFRYLDMEALKKTPILFIGGTEDQFGFIHLYHAAQYMEDQKLDVRHIFVGGGQHLTAWADELDAIFEFFKEKSEC